MNYDAVEDYETIFFISDMTLKLYNRVGKTTLDGCLTSTFNSDYLWENYRENYKGDRVMTILTQNAKDIFALAMDVNFAKYINQNPTTSEFVIRTGTKYKVLDNDGIRHVVIKEK